MLGLKQAMMMQNADVSPVNKLIYNYPHLTHTSPLNTPPLAWYFFFSRLESFTSLQKTPPKTAV
jgi:hypothetical protein